MFLFRRVEVNVARFGKELKRAKRKGEASEVACGSEIEMLSLKSSGSDGSEWSGPASHDRRYGGGRRVYCSRDGRGSAQVNAGLRASLTTGHVVSGVEKGAGTRRYSVPGAQVYCRGPGPSCVFLRGSKFNENPLKLLSVSHYATLKVDHTRLPSVGFRS